MPDQTQLVDELRRRIAYPTVYLPRELDHAGNPAETEDRWAARAVAAGLEDGTLGYVPAAQQLHRADFDHLAAERDRWKNHSTQVQFESDRLTVQLAAIRELAKRWTSRPNTPEHDCGVDILKTLGRFDGGAAPVPGSSRRAQECSQACTEGHQYDETCELGSSRRAQDDPMPVFVIKAKDEFALAAIRAYRALCDEHGLRDQAREVGKAHREMREWRVRHPELIKLPDHKHVPADEDQASEPTEQCDECETTGVNCRAHRTAEQQQRAGW